MSLQVESTITISHQLIVTATTAGPVQCSTVQYRGGRTGQGQQDDEVVLLGALNVHAGHGMIHRMEREHCALACMHLRAGRQSRKARTLGGPTWHPAQRIGR